MIHRAFYGSIERFLGILIEHYAGKFPLWLSPLQLRILTVADRHEPYATSSANSFKDAGFHVEVDSASESVSKKIRNAQLAQANYILTIGDQEVEHQTANLRTRDNVVHGEINPDDFQRSSRKKEDARIESPYAYRLKIKKELAMKTMQSAALKGGQPRPPQPFTSAQRWRNFIRRKSC